MARTRYAHDRIVSAAAAATAVASAGGAVALTGAAAIDLDTFSAAAVVDIAALKTELAAIRAKLGF